jgi:DedD protein
MTIIRAMDRSLKARLIGASVLVLLAVLLVPELLSGRKAATNETSVATAGDGQTRTYTIELGKPGSSGVAGAAPRPAFSPDTPPLASERPVRDRKSAESDAKSAAPAAIADARPPLASAVERGTSAAPDPAPTKPALPGEGSANPSPEAEHSAAPASVSRGTGSVQVGAFGSQESAQKLVRQLESDGFSAYVSAAERNGKQLHRVRVGPESARAAADALAGRLRARGLPVTLVAND